MGTLNLSPETVEAMPDNVTISIWNVAISFIHSCKASRAEPSNGNNRTRCLTFRDILP